MNVNAPAIGLTALGLLGTATGIHIAQSIKSDAHPLEKFFGVVAGAVPAVLGVFAGANAVGALKPSSSFAATVLQYGAVMGAVTLGGVLAGSAVTALREAS
jgi:hypothetical protein